MDVSKYLYSSTSLTYIENTYSVYILVLISVGYQALYVEIILKKYVNVFEI